MNRRLVKLCILFLFEVYVSLKVLHPPLVASTYSNLTWVVGLRGDAESKYYKLRAKAPIIELPSLNQGCAEIGLNKIYLGGKKIELE
ncbi:protein of unknown function [Legionella micdadei]|uniref:Uncharacterized protein n=1 Tax=Legionella micdadei TaxID=451 RepID=A0A098GH84_LEGMI|nr:protein of unknown function [Legionella micdadei]